MKPAQNGASPTSLQRVQALEKSALTLDEKLNEVCHILKNVTICEAHFLNSIASNSNSHSKYHGRAEWAARWTVSKIRGNTPEAKEARANPRIWLLLGNLVAILPPAVVARTFTSHSFLSSLLQTFQDLLAVDFGHEVGLDSHKETGEHGHGSGLERGVSPSTSKRKRDKSDFAETVVKKHKLDEKKSKAIRSATSRSSRALYTAVMRCLKIITAGGVNLVAPTYSLQLEYLASVLRADCSLAAKLVGSCLSIQFSLMQVEGEKEKNQDVQLDRTISDVDAVLKIWSLRTVASQGGSTNSSLEFSRECLLPSTLFLGTVSGGQNSYIQNHTNDARSLERLVAKHILLPAREHFHASSNSKSKGTLDDGPDLSISTFVQPLRSVQYESSDAVDGIRCMAVSKLFRLAIRAYPLSTPRRKVAEAKWLNHLFSNLATCIGYEALTSRSFKPFEPSSVDLGPLKSLLQITIDEEVSISTSLLRKIIFTYSGIEDQENVDWKLISQVLELDNTIFNGDISENGPSLLKNLLSNTTNGIWIESAKESSEERKYGAYEVVKSKIIVPLLKAFASSRQLLSFLELWRYELRSAQSIQNTGSTKGETKMCRFSVWQELSLSDALSERLRTDMTDQRILEFVQTLASSFEGLKNLNKHKDAYPQTCGDISMLYLVIRSIANYETLQKLEQVLSNTFLQCVDAITETHLQWTILRSLIWRLTSTVHHKLTAVIESLQSPQHVRSLVMIVCQRLEQFDNYAEANAAEEVITSLAALQSIINDLSARNMVQKEDDQWLTSLIKAMASFFQKLDNLNSPLADTIAVILAAMQSLPINKESNTLITGTECSNAVPAWQMLLKRSLDSTTGNTRAILLALNSLQSSTSMNKSNRPALDRNFWLLIESYRSILPSTVPRRQREDFVDVAVDLCQNLDPFEEHDSFVELLSAVMRMLRAPCGNSKLCKEPEPLLNVANYLDRVSERHSTVAAAMVLKADILGLFEHLASQAYSTRFTVNDVTDFEKKVKMFEAESKAVLRESTKGGLYPSTLRMLATGTKVLVSSHKKLSAASDTFTDLQTHLCENICNVLDSLRQTHQKGRSAETSLARQQVTELLNFLSVLDDHILDKNESKMNQTLQFLPKSNIESSQLENDAAVSEDVFRFELTSKIETARNGTLDVQHASALLGLANSTEKKKITRIVSSYFIRVTPQQSKDSYRSILDQFRAHAAAVGPTRMLLISTKALVKRKDDIEHEFSECIVLVCQQIVATKSIKRVSIMTDILSTVREVQSKHLSQYALEAILSALENLVSKSAQDLPFRAAGFIYAQMCKIVRNILTVHRRKLRGRFGILTRLLQSLLRCLFVPFGPSGGAMSASGRRPPWLSTEQPLTREHASAFTRLLTLICEPTTSSVSTRSNRLKLTDETRKARAYAGEYMTYILMEYCDGQLQGRLPHPAMREQLMPGLYAACSVVELAGMQEVTMAALSAPARVVFKALWEDWKKFGRWNGA